MTVTFFTDRDLGKQLPRQLREAGLAVEAHHDHFAPKTPDEEWLLAAGARGWFVLTHDRHIRYRPNQRDAVMRADLGLFILIGAAPYVELAANVINSQRQILSFIEQHERPFIAKIHRPAPSVIAKRPGAPGDVTLWLAKADWRPSP